MTGAVSGDILVEHAFESWFVFDPEKAAGGEGVAMERGGSRGVGLSGGGREAASGRFAGHLSYSL